MQCGPLSVTHLLLFSRSEAGNTNFRLSRTPKGPTLSFRVEKYSLAKDIQKSQKHPRQADDYQVAPLLVVNNMVTSDAEREKLGDAATPKHLEKLTSDMLQGLFPPIDPTRTPLQSIRRVLLVDRTRDDQGSLVLNLRHYAITTRVAGLPKALRRLHAAEKLIGSKEKKRKALPNLGGLEDVADYMLDPSGAGYTSASETDFTDAEEVEVSAPTTRKVLSRREREKAAENGRKAMSRGGGRKVEKRAVKLVELGPRMKLRLTKVEEDICSGKVLWHEFISKSKEEVEKLDEVWEQRKKEKEERRRIQKENIEKKRKEREEKGEEGDEDEDMEDYDEYDWDDDVWHDEDDEAAENDDGAEKDEDEEMEDDQDNE